MPRVSCATASPHRRRRCAARAPPCAVSINSVTEALPACHAGMAGWRRSGGVVTERGMCMQRFVNAWRGEFEYHQAIDENLIRERGSLMLSTPPSWVSGQDAGYLTPGPVPMTVRALSYIIVYAATQLEESAEDREASCFAKGQLRYAALFQSLGSPCHCVSKVVTSWTRRGGFGCRVLALCVWLQGFPRDLPGEQRFGLTGTCLSGCIGVTYVSVRADVLGLPV